MYGYLVTWLLSVYLRFWLLRRAVYVNGQRTSYSGENTGNMDNNAANSNFSEHLSVWQRVGNGIDGVGPERGEDEEQRLPNNQPHVIVD